MPAPSLAWLARQTIIKNISSEFYLLPHVSSPILTKYLVLTDVGDIPYDLLRPVLLKIENAKQLVSLCQCTYLYD